MHPYNQLTDIELAEQLGKGEEGAFREIYVRYWDKLYIVARKRLKDSLEAEETIQDIFCNLWRKRETFTLSKGFDNYFAVAVKFEVINRLAKKARQSVVEKEVSASLSEADYSTLQTLDLNELKDQLQQSINELPDKCRIVFRMKYEKDYSQHQIAEELHISEKTVEAHLAKARKTLRSSFGNALGILIGILITHS